MFRISSGVANRNRLLPLPMSIPAVLAEKFPDDSNGSIVVSVKDDGSFTVTVERVYGPY